MSVQEWTFLMVGISFAVYILIAFKSRAQSTSDFYVAGKGVNPIVNGSPYEIYNLFSYNGGSTPK